MNVKRVATSTAMRDFTQRVKDYVDESIYPIVFDTFTRESDKKRFKDNDGVAGCYTLNKQLYWFSEKFLRKDVLGFPYEVAHLDSHSNWVLGQGLKSIADTFIYLVWDTDTDTLIKAVYINNKWLHAAAGALYKQYLKNPKAALPEGLEMITGDKLRDGTTFKSIVYRFSLDDVPSIAFRHIKDEGV